MSHAYAGFAAHLLRMIDHMPEHLLDLRGNAAASWEKLSSACPRDWGVASRQHGFCTQSFARDLRTKLEPGPEQSQLLHRPTGPATKSTPYKSKKRADLPHGKPARYLH
jgi:hypothetical protein